MLHLPAKAERPRERSNQSLYIHRALYLQGRSNSLRQETRKGMDSHRLMEAVKHGVATIPLSISVRAGVSCGPEKITTDKAQVDRVQRHQEK